MGMELTFCILNEENICILVKMQNLFLCNEGLEVLKMAAVLDTCESTLQEEPEQAGRRNKHILFLMTPSAFFNVTRLPDGTQSPPDPRQPPVAAPSLCTSPYSVFSVP